MLNFIKEKYYRYCILLIECGIKEWDKIASTSCSKKALVIKEEQRQRRILLSYYQGKL